MNDLILQHIRAVDMTSDWLIVNLGVVTFVNNWHQMLVPYVMISLIRPLELTLLFVIFSEEVKSLSAKIPGKVYDPDDWRKSAWLRDKLTSRLFYYETLHIPNPLRTCCGKYYSIVACICFHSRHKLENWFLLTVVIALLSLLEVP